MDLSRTTQCATCGVEYRAAALPEVCPICADERQYVPAEGQQWVDPARTSARIHLEEREPGLWGVVVENGTGLNQQAKVIVTPEGNVMAEAPSAITEEGVRAVRALGPLRAIIPSHPHMFGLQSAWSAALDDAPVYVAAVDADWLGLRPAALRLWDGTLSPVPGVTASQPGGHFPGSVVVHWTAADGKGALLAGDTIYVNPDLRTAGFMRSYPNRIPLSGGVVRRMAEHVSRYDYDRLYCNFGNRIDSDAKAAVEHSAERHIRWVSGDFDDLT